MSNLPEIGFFRNLPGVGGRSRLVEPPSISSPGDFKQNDDSSLNEGHSSAYHLVPTKGGRLEQHGQQMGTPAGTSLNMCSKPQQTAEMNTSHCMSQVKRMNVRCCQAATLLKYYSV